MAASSERWALITGVGEGGLGDALATTFSSRGINVIATALDLKHLDYLRKSEKGSARIEKLQLDVTSSDSISSAAEKAKSITNGSLDFLVNNAGYGYMMPLLDASITAIKQNFDVNVFGAIAVTQAFFPLLREAKGTVVMQSSIAGQPGISQPFIGTYSASKTALTDFSNTLRVELAPFDVNVVTLFTGDVKTGFWHQGHVQGSHVGLPANSEYRLMKEHAEKMMRGETNPPRQTRREDWAEGVVEDLLRSNVPTAIRRGSLSSIMWVVSLLAPTWLLDWMFWQTCKLKDFKDVLEAEQRKKSL